MHIKKCPSCDHSQFDFRFEKAGQKVVECHQCGLMFFNPQPTDEVLTTIYSGNEYYLGSTTEAGAITFSNMKKATSRLYLKQLAKYRGSSRGKLLEIGCGPGDFLFEAEQAGFEVTGLELNPAAVEKARAALSEKATVHCGMLEEVNLPKENFDVCVLLDVIEHVRDPVAFLKGIREIMSKEGVLLIATPSLDSWSAKLLKKHWMEFKVEHLYYFDSQTISNVLRGSGFTSPMIKGNQKTLTLDYIAKHFDRFPVPVVSTLVKWGARCLPRFIKHKQFNIVASGITVFSRVAIDGMSHA